ncbi:Transcriptional regulator, AraC family [uncultured Pleomorphomonas sp.]|uniref:Transcriptional regulator, AraC family n=1 Tax=uncultured Pleomorphomonas sp. TaxID=442121 RepID=A0A212LPT0_9HYPH|nr:AraC family transcriptional regulator [uncultured Pleomorphomonas sp.]SCM79516.1 Transcriptional regulator, AraC family [uncultured Pleomorphomonas sp.]
MTKPDRKAAAQEKAKAFAARPDVSTQSANALAPASAAGLERSCGRFSDGLRVAIDDGGVERLEARFHGNGFSPHRHDTYALGLTLHGVQTFRYRGALRFSRPGNVIVLHPDELHDGAAGDEAGLIYRMIYLPPEMIAATHATRGALPFVADPVVRDAGLRQALADILADLEGEPGGLEMDDVLMRVAAGLVRQAGLGQARASATAEAAVRRARDYLASHATDSVRSETLEAVTGLDRYELARQFRRLAGTSPHRFLIMRRLDRAKRLIASGLRLADAALDAGFADQAHFTRHFRGAFGMPPGRWLAMQKAAM